MNTEYNEFKNFKAVSFEVGANQYIYDTFSNRFAKVDRCVLEIIEDTFQLTKAEIINKYKDRYDSSILSHTFDNIENLKRDHKMFLNFTIPSLSISAQKSTLDKVKEKVSCQLNKIIFNVTEDCNFRCEYCVYSGNYPYRRVHNKSNDISWPIGKKSIDFFLKNSNLSKDRYVSFYGGEPLLNFGFINKMVKYTKKIADNIKFEITTNGSLLDEDKIKFIVENNLGLSISLDGPQQIHDRFRKFESNKPTHNLIIKRIEYLKKNYPTYYSSKLSINVVLTPHDKDFNTLNDYFAKQPLFSGLKDAKKISIGVVNPAINSYVEKYKYNDFFYKYLAEMFKIYKYYLINSMDITEIPIAKDLLARFIKTIHFRTVKPLSDYTYYWPNGICIPGMRTLFVSADGSFYPCEKIYDYGRMYIGNVFDGFDYERIAHYIDEYSKTAYQDCRNCWLFRLCSVCFLNICDYRADTFNLKKRRPFCEALKYVMASYLKLYVSIREQNDHAFDYLPVEEKWQPAYIDQMIDE